MKISLILKCNVEIKVWQRHLATFMELKIIYIPHYTATKIKSLKKEIKMQNHSMHKFIVHLTCWILIKLYLWPQIICTKKRLYLLIFHNHSHRMIMRRHTGKKPMNRKEFFDDDDRNNNMYEREPLMIDRFWFFYIEQAKNSSIISLWMWSAHCMCVCCAQENKRKILITKYFFLYSCRVFFVFHLRMGLFMSAVTHKSESFWL